GVVPSVKLLPVILIVAIRTRLLEKRLLYLIFPNRQAKNPGAGSASSGEGRITAAESLLRNVLTPALKQGDMLLCTRSAPASYKSSI
ncbi:MAG: hypothetical protein LUC06_00085, partial [Oscillospiraceae bacterium]|nr:hypothetical protein [Oscillospiraceae bacterium]